MRTTPAELLQGGIALWAGALADYGPGVRNASGQPLAVISTSQPVETQGIQPYASRRKSFVDWQDEPIDLDPMPAVRDTASFARWREADGPPCGCSPLALGSKS